MVNDDGDQSRLKILSFLFKEVCEELRARRTPEYTYVPAFVAASGAIIWGVSTLASVAKKSSLAASIPSIGILLIAIFIIVKILKEHKIYKELRKKQAILFSCINEDAIIKDIEIYSSWSNGQAGKGFIWSIIIVGVAAITAAIFCWAV
jgi:hypothetical protein